MDRLRCLADEAAAANLGNFANWADTEPPLRYIYIHTEGGLMAKPNRERERGEDVSQVHTVCHGETGRYGRQENMST
jgi:hypothetical protein